jgi:CheY-like chemotaxis protein
VAVYDTAGCLLPELARYADEVDVVPLQGLTDLEGSFGAGIADVVLVNEGDAHELLRLLRRVGDLVGDAPVLGTALSPRTRRAKQSGVMDYLLKPVTRVQLQGVLGQLPARPKRVLVVEDDADAGDLFRRMLHACDASLAVDSVASGAEALGCLAEHRYDLVLLDVILPDMTGWEIADRMQRDGGERNPAIAVVSAQDPADDPPRSPLLVAALESGLSVSQMLRSALMLSRLVLTPGDALGPASAQNPADGLASRERLPRPVQGQAVPL